MEVGGVTRSDGRGPYQAHPLWVLGCVWRYRDLVWQMSTREVASRYRGSFLGMLWAFLTPLMMLAVYTFAFGFILQVRWGTETGGPLDAVFMLFAGLILYWFFSDCIVRAPQLIVTNVNFVKKVVFPLEILPWVSLATALFGAAMNLLVFLLFWAVLHHSLPLTVGALPVVLIPLLFTTVGLSWLLASLGVYLRDIGQTTSLAVNALLFLSPVLYPVSAVPASVQPYMLLNPLTTLIEQTRQILIRGNVPNWRVLGILTICSWGIAWLGLAWFQKTRRGFADVL